LIKTFKIGSIRHWGTKSGNGASLGREIVLPQPTRGSVVSTRGNFSVFLALKLDL